MYELGTPKRLMARTLDVYVQILVSNWRTVIRISCARLSVAGTIWIQSGATCSTGRSKLEGQAWVVCVAIRFASFNRLTSVQCQVMTWYSRSNYMAVLMLTSLLRTALVLATISTAVSSVVFKEANLGSTCTNNCQDAAKWILTYYTLRWP